MDGHGRQETIEESKSKVRLSDMKQTGISAKHDRKLRPRYSEKG